MADSFNQHEKISVPPKATLLTRKSEKWRAFDSEILPMPFAVMDYDLAQPIKDSLISLISASDAGYLGKFPELGESLAMFAKSRWDWEIEPGEIKICTDVGVGVIEVCRQVVGPGDQIMINTPVYFNFFNWIKELNCKVYDAPLIENDLKYSLDFEAIEKGYSTGVKVHILCNPHNPVGAIFSKADLAKLADLAKKYGVLIAADEIHAPLVFKENNFVPFLTSSEAAREVGIAFLSATKSWNIAGTKCAQIVAVHPKTKAIIDRLPTAVHSRASLFGAVASAAAYRDSIDWLDAVIEELDNSRRHLKSLLADLEIGYKPPDAGYFGWLDLRTLSTELAQNKSGDIAEILLAQGKIAVAPGHLYGPSGSGFIRINFATSREIIDDSVTRISKVLSSVK
jgi:cystathionine beta-lyase